MDSGFRTCADLNYVIDIQNYVRKYWIDAFFAVSVLEELKLLNERCCC